MWENSVIYVSINEKNNRDKVCKAKQSMLWGLKISFKFAG